MERSATATVEDREGSNLQSAATAVTPAPRARAAWAPVVLTLGPVVAVVAAAVLTASDESARGPALIAFLVGLGATITAERSLRSGS